MDEKELEEDLWIPKYRNPGSKYYNYEGDDLLGLVQDCEDDNKLIRKKKEQKDLSTKAEKVIEKYNNNSIRIIDSMKNQS